MTKDQSPEPSILSPDNEKSIYLDLGDKAVITGADGKRQEVIRNLSGAAIIGQRIYLANDEGRALLQLTRTTPRHYENPRLVELTELFDIADETNEKKEFDLEGLAVDRIDSQRTRLWVIGSHAMGHAKPEDDRFEYKELGLKRERNRLLFGCVDVGKNGLIPGSGRHLRIERLGDASYTTEFLRDVRAAPPSANGLLAEIAALTGADIPKAIGGRIGWFTPYTMASTKENGLDVEGLAIRRNGEDSRVVALVGLRGPVINGFAVLIEVAIRDRKNYPRDLKLVGDPRFHLLDLGGFGVRDLEWRGRDLLILAGPTMTRQKESAIFRWNDAWTAIKEGGDRVAKARGIQEIGALPMPEEHSGPEVIATIAATEPEYMVLRDGIGKCRLCDRNGNASELGPVYRTEVYRIADR